MIFGTHTNSVSLSIPTKTKTKTSLNCMASGPETKRPTFLGLRQSFCNSRISCVVWNECLKRSAICRICFQIQRRTLLWYSVEYSSFSVGPETDKYRLSVSGFSGDTGDALTAVAPSKIVDGMQFSTVDQDNDHYDGECSERFSAWWFNNCARSALNMDEYAMWNTATNTAVRNVASARMFVKLG